MCNKCEKLHSGLFENHHQYILGKDNEEIFTGFCKIENHSKLEFFCIDHNQLCCAACISKIKDEKYGAHADCDVCPIKNIKDEKKKNLSTNITSLENLSKGLEKSIDELKQLYDKIKKDKEELKINIQKIFSEIRNAINKREDELLLEADNTFNNLYFGEDLIKISEKLQKKIKISLDNGKKINDEWNNDNKLSSLINGCINIEMNISEIETINEKLEKANITNIDIDFTPKIIEENDFYLKIKDFGKINFTEKMDLSKEYEMLQKKYEKSKQKFENELNKKQNKKSTAYEKAKIEEKEYNNLKKEFEDFEKNKTEEISKLKQKIEEEEEESNERSSPRSSSRSRSSSRDGVVSD
jgi:DNA repair exonuclease SbcCD ATPase subunit